MLTRFQEDNYQPLEGIHTGLSHPCLWRRVTLAPSTLAALMDTASGHTDRGCWCQDLNLSPLSGHLLSEQSKRLPDTGRDWGHLSPALARGDTTHPPCMSTQSTLLQAVACIPA